MPAFPTIFSNIPQFAADFAGRAAVWLFQPGFRQHDGSHLETLAGPIRSSLNQNGQAPVPGVFSNLYCTGSVYRSFANALVALAGGGQANATPIATGLARFGTVATAGDSAVLPAQSPGLHPIIHNAGAAAMNLYPAPGEAINALAVNAPFSIPPGRIAMAMCAAPGVWSIGLLATA